MWPRGLVHSRVAPGSIRTRPAGVGFQPVVVAAQRGQVGFAGGPGGVGDHVVQVALHRGPAAAGEAAVPVAGAHPAGQPGCGPVAARRGRRGEVDQLGVLAQVGGVVGAERAVAGQFRAAGGEQHLHRDGLAQFQAGQAGHEQVGAGRVDTAPSMFAAPAASAFQQACASSADR